MSTNTAAQNNEFASRLRAMYSAEYAGQSPSGAEAQYVPSMLNALGACAGFAAQAAVWRELILPAKRNPGDFLYFAVTKSHETFFRGDATNRFLFASEPDRLSFMSVAAAVATNAADIPDILELLRRVYGSIGGEAFGRPRLPTSIMLPELSRAALARTWGKTAKILQDRRPAEWPMVLGMAAFHLMSSNKAALTPAVALRILSEAAVPVSILDPASVEQSGIPAPTLAGWSTRARSPDAVREIQADVNAVMPAIPASVAGNPAMIHQLHAASQPTIVQQTTTVARPFVIHQPSIAFLNLAGPGHDAMVESDVAEIGGLFHGKVTVATAPGLTCDVLFLYCDLDLSGKIVGQGTTLRDLIGSSGAKVAVVASETQFAVMSNPEFAKALAKRDNDPTNLVIIGNRNGEAFGRFFRSLFEAMWAGVSMPMAWVRISPQGPIQRSDVPGAICALEAGHLVFE